MCGGGPWHEKLSGVFFLRGVFVLQGIVPAKAAKMAAKSVTLMTEKLINIKVGRVWHEICWPPEAALGVVDDTINSWSTAAGHAVISDKHAVVVSACPPGV